MDRNRSLSSPIRQITSLAICVALVASLANTAFAQGIVPPAPGSDSSDQADRSSQPHLNSPGAKNAKTAPPMPPRVKEKNETAGTNGLPERAVARPIANEVRSVEGGWTIQITPVGVRSQQPRPKEESSDKQVAIDPIQYNRIYQSIPYRRSEYLANPSYRHDATMEILFGEMRPTVIHRTDQAERVVNPRPEFYQSPAIFEMLEFWRNTNSSWWSPSFVRPFLFPRF